MDTYGLKAGNYSRANKDWLMIDWNKDIEIIDGVRFNIGGYLTTMGIVIEEA